jgi:hypothetical protein
VFCHDLVGFHDDFFIGRNAQILKGIEDRVTHATAYAGIGSGKFR